MPKARKSSQQKPQQLLVEGKNGRHAIWALCQQYQLPETFSVHPKAEAILQELEQAGLNRYSLIHHPKALIHTWLAWQEKPGMPMGQAITAQALRCDSPIALIFVEWLKHLFELSARSAG